MVKETADGKRAREDGKRPVRRHEAADDRDRSAEDRDRTAEGRDEVSEAHQQASAARDAYADDRDRRADAREQVATAGGDLGASSDRAGALRDRRGAATDREHAADDRQAASTDRVLSAADRAASSVDELTGAYRRAAGLAELRRETARARRTHEPFVLAFVDVDNLKVVNDSLGHASGDQLLRRVVESITRHFRPYDLIVRFGGDEFLCALLDITIQQAAERFALINADLAVRPQVSITAGLAALEADDSLDDVIERADAALRAERKQRATARH